MLFTSQKDAKAVAQVNEMRAPCPHLEDSTISHVTFRSVLVQQEELQPFGAQHSGMANQYPGHLIHTKSKVDI